MRRRIREVQQADPLNVVRLGNRGYFAVEPASSEDRGMPLHEQWTVLLDRYATSLRAARRATGTVRLHLHYLHRLARHVAPFRPGDVRTTHLEEFLARHAWEPETAKSARTCVRGFFAWARKHGHVDQDPAAELPPVSIPEPLARPTPERLVQELVSCGDERIELMAMLAAYGGLRACELSTVHSRDLVGDMLHVKGKGGKVRRVPIVHAELLRRIQSVEGWAFPGRIDGHLSAGHVTRLLSRALEDHWTGHTLRHRCATVAFAKTRDILGVGKLLGHSRTSTTQRYVQYPDDALRAVAAAAAA